MDKLIDNREFPKEMHQKQEQSKGSKTPVFLIVLVIFAVLIVAFLVYEMFFIKKGRQQEEHSYSTKDQVEVINNFSKGTPALTEQKRQEKIDVFFNN